MWFMSFWVAHMDKWTIVSAGFVQGLGWVCTFMPMNIVSSRPWNPKYRPDAASIINLVRNIGGSFGISCHHYAAGAQYTKSVIPTWRHT